MTKKICGYCGIELTRANTDKEHVFPKCLYPKSKRNSKIQRLTIPSCNSCNNGWSDDEAHFRNILMVAGDAPNSPRQEIWNGPILRSFDEIDGSKRLNELYQLLKPTCVDDQERYRVFPAEDDRILRIVRKIVRGLCYHHKVLYPVMEN